MEKITFKATDTRTGKTTTVEALHDDNFVGRKGYNRNFLGKSVPLPKLSKRVKDKVATLPKAGRNGKKVLDYTNFSVMFNKDKKMPFFSAVNIEGSTNELAGIHDARLGDKWFNDKRILVGEDFFQYTNKDYSKSGFQKGHMTRFYDPAWGKTPEQKKIAMGDTFYYTNCCPQKGKYNAGIWNDLEDYYMARAIFQDEKVSVFTGPVFNGAIQVGKLLVPIHFWKVLVYKIKDKLEAMAFLISHKFDVEIATDVGLESRTEGKQANPTLSKEDIERLFEQKNLKKWVVKIELIEEKTGLNFGLNEVDINKIENKYFNIDVEKLDSTADKMKMILQSMKENFTAVKVIAADTEYIKNI